MSVIDSKIFSDAKIKNIVIAYLDEKILPTMQTLMIENFDHSLIRLMSFGLIFKTSDRILKKLNPLETAKIYYEQLPLKDKNDFIKFCFSWEDNNTAKKFAIANNIMYASIALTDPSKEIREFASFCYQKLKNDRKN